MMAQVSSAQTSVSRQPVARRRTARRAKAASPKQSHIAESVLASFCEAWMSNPDSVDDETFDTIQLHLLGCKNCAATAKHYEDLYLARPMRTATAA